MSDARRFLFTVDADWVPGSGPGLLALLDLCQALGLRATIFTTGMFALHHPEAIARAHAEGHEIGVHGWEHPMPVFMAENYRFTPLDRRRNWLRQATDAVAGIIGEPPRAFRAPYLWIDGATLHLLEELGYVVDSSVPTRRFDGLVGMVNHLDYFLAPLAPYRPDPRRPGRRGSGQLLEIPPSAWLLPLNMSTVRFLGWRASLAVAGLIGRASSLLNFYCHPWEFVASAALTFPPGTPARHTRATGPHLLTGLAAFVDGILRRGYRSVTVAEVARCVS